MALTGTGPPPLQATLTLKEFRIYRQKVQKAKERSIRTGIVRGLIFIRTRSRSSIRRTSSGKASAPGKPPKAHSKGRGIKTILWEYFPDGGYGVVGPVKINQDPKSARADVTTPNALESGGSITFPAGGWFKIRRAALGDKVTRLKRRRRVRIKPRPFMLPALEKEVEAGTIVGGFRATFRE